MSGPAFGFGVVRKGSTPISQLSAHGGGGVSGSRSPKVRFVFLCPQRGFRVSALPHLAAVPKLKQPYKATLQSPGACAATAGTQGWCWATEAMAQPRQHSQIPSCGLSAPAVSTEESAELQPRIPSQARGPGFPNPGAPPGRASQPPSSFSPPHRLLLGHAGAAGSCWVLACATSPGAGGCQRAGKEAGMCDGSVRGWRGRTVTQALPQKSAMPAHPTAPCTGVSTP